MFSNLILPIIIIFTFLLTLIYLIFKKPKSQKRTSDTPLFNAHVSNDRPVDLNILDEVFIKLKKDNNENLSETFIKFEENNDDDKL